MRYMFYFFVFLVLIYLYILYNQHKDTILKSKESFTGAMKASPLEPSLLTTTHKSRHSRYMNANVTTTNMFNKV